MCVMIKNITKKTCHRSMYKRVSARVYSRKCVPTAWMGVAYYILLHSTLIAFLSNEVNLRVTFVLWFVCLQFFNTISLISGPPSERISFQWHTHTHAATDSLTCESAAIEIAMQIKPEITTTIKTAQIMRAIERVIQRKRMWEWMSVWMSERGWNTKITIKLKWRRALRY